MNGYPNSRMGVILCCLCIGCLNAHAGILTVDIADPSCVAISGQPDPYAVVYCNIESAVTDSVSGDVIQVYAGTYTPTGGRIILDKSITLQAHPSLGVSGPHPQVRPKIMATYTSYTNCAIQIAANDCVVDGFEIEGVYGGGHYILGDYGAAMNGWTVRNCDIHHARNCIRPVGNTITIECNDLHETESDLINAEYGACYGLTVTHNWLHSHHTNSGAKPAGITYNCSSTTPGAWADVDFSYNYCWASRTFVDFQNNGGLSPANTVSISHNTVDWWIGALPDPVQASDLAQQMSLAWWTGSGNWNGPNFSIRDNLMTRQKWYMVVDTDLLLQGPITLVNCLFWQWYLVDAYYPSSASDHEYPGPRGAVGWDEMGAGNEFVMTGCITSDPAYASTGVRPDEYYALAGPDSPAYQAATDGTNIGAWQGIFAPTETPTEIPSDTPTITPTDTETPTPTETPPPTDTPTVTPTDTPSPTPTSGTPTATPTALPVPATGSGGVAVLLLALTAWIGLASRKR